MNIAVLTALGTLILGLLGVGVKLGKAQAQIDGMKENLGNLREDIDRRLDEKASAVSVQALKEAVDLLRQDITTKLDALMAELRRKDSQ